MTWTAARKGQVCPGCASPFAEGDPMALLTARRLKRCAVCVSPAPVDWDAVHAVNVARESQRTGEPVVPVPQTFERVTPGSLNAALKDAGILGVRRSRQPEPRGPKPFAEVADDPDVARTGGE
jgi:hypothetical protein